MRSLRRLLILLGLPLFSLVAGCQAPQRMGNAGSQTTEIAPEPPARQGNSSGYLLNSNSMLLGPGGGSPSGYRWFGDGEWGFLR